MVTVIRGLRKSPVLTSSGLACLSKLPTINLAMLKESRGHASLCPPYIGFAADWRVEPT